MESCAATLESVQTLNDRTDGPLERNSHKMTQLPFVFVLGNHSSGKSSFINYVLQKDVQQAGVAPTDDAFTIIAPGEQDGDRDGPSVIGDPDLGFAGLRHYGPGLVHQTSLKVRQGLRASNFMMVDSPGMIDSPVSRDSVLTKDNSRDRGYDFEGVVKWFAERADVILLFFDPDKPGTTGETLRVLTKSLAGLDHKLYIVLNKADQFRKIHDFARAYGSLCWNLSKVIARKDLPRIYTMCLPPRQRQNTTTYGAGDEEQPLGQGLQDLEKTREDVVAEVMKAPKRRMDNAITRLGDSISLLRMHVMVLEEARRIHRAHLWQSRAIVFAGVTVTAAAAGGAAFVGLPPAFIGVVSVAGMGLAGGNAYFGGKTLEQLEEKYATYEGLQDLFLKTHKRELSEEEEYAKATWSRVRETARSAILHKGLSSLQAVSSSEIRRLRDVLDVEIPALRRKAGQAL
uniref:Dynamin N-terminal domain-containing protein n=1 Tax=Pinguiococcus pyrenoidosus TaxID=172671 RepID=A0A7R9U1U8_9STRA|mmetsp:Transcript_11598/g.43276  ORF Transcript_11598/g.43276 Transcript_11598/m.43276 type:complete len:457 (+) Transcript_11598:119-1489(+)|eukprot:scaffold2448_cov250-Pinguiococcus_pyrenoidosus.AAC.6